MTTRNVLAGLKMSCKIPGCKKEMELETFDQHVEFCSNSMTSCDICGDRIVTTELQHHKDNQHSAHVIAEVCSQKSIKISIKVE